jgi:hypothetical protein
MITTLSQYTDIGCALGQAGASHVVVDAMTSFSSNRDVCRHGCAAIKSLASQDANRRLLAQAGACETVLGAMGNLSSDRDVCQLGCGAVRNLLSNRENMEDLPRKWAGNREIGICLSALGAIESLA